MIRFTTDRHLSSSQSIASDLYLATSESSLANPIPFTSTFLSNSGAPSYALYLPPRLPRTSTVSSPPTILAMHGAGTDVLLDKEWASSLAPQKSGVWVVFPTGLTEWGFDWHGPSLVDATRSVENVPAVERLFGTLDAGASVVPGRLIVVGHSNGGQGEIAPRRACADGFRV